MLYPAELSCLKTKNLTTEVVRLKVNPTGLSSNYFIADVVKLAFLIDYMNYQ